MSEERQKRQKRTLIDFSKILPLVGQDIIMCVPKTVLHIARELAGTRGLWLSSYFVDDLGQRYTIPSDVDFAPIRSDIARFFNQTESEIYMCNDLLIETLQGIRDAINSSGSGCGCGGSVGAGATEGPPSTTEPGNPGDQVGDPPEGFSTWPEYESYKCDYAEYILSRVENDLAWIETIDLVGLTVSALLVGLASPIPGDELLLLVALILELVALGVVAAAVDDMQDAITNYRDDYICAMYEAGSATDAKAALELVINDSVDAEASGVYAALVKLILGAFFSYDNINGLFDKDTYAVTNNLLPTGDCSMCQQCFLTEVIVLNAFEIDPEPDPKWEIQFDASDAGALSRGCCYIITDVDQTGWVEHPTDVNLAHFDCGNSGTSMASASLTRGPSPHGNWPVSDITYQPYYQDREVEYMRFIGRNSFSLTLTVQWL